MRRFIVYLILAAFLANCSLPVSYAQSPIVNSSEMASLSPGYRPAMLTGMKVYPNDPFRFDFILDRGDAVNENDLLLQEESNRLIKYFLASLTVPEEDLWVNLSPYEQDRIVPDAFGQTEMGRDLLSQDYFLKQITSSLMFPDSALGKKFWTQVYKEARLRFGTTEIPLDTFNKVWITPEKAVVYEKGAVAYVVESRFKVLLESDYLALKQQGKDVATGGCSGEPGSPDCAAQELSKQIIRQIILPALEKEVNEGSNFSRLRQVYHSLILASWYKKKIKASLLSQVYVDKNKVQGVNVDDPRIAKKIWDEYVEAFKKGAFNLIREERDAMTDELIPRKYFSGGITLRADFTEERAMNVQNLPRETLVLQTQVEAAQSVERIVQSILGLSNARWEKNTPADLLKWVEQVAQAADHVLTAADIDLIAKELGVSPVSLEQMKLETRARALAGLGFYTTLPQDQKTNVYLLRSGILLYLAERILGFKEPRAVYLSKAGLEAVAQDKMTVRLFIPAMIAETKARLGWPRTRMLPAGEANLAKFRNEFYKLYQEIISSGELKLASAEATRILSVNRDQIRQSAESVRNYFEKEGILSPESGREGVRLIDTTMPGNLVLFAEAVMRAGFESFGYRDANERVDSRMFYSGLSEAMSFIKQDKKQYARASELMTYPFQFTGKINPEGPEIVMSGNESEKKEFVLQVLLFKSELLKLRAQREVSQTEPEAVLFRDSFQNDNRDLIRLLTSQAFLSKTQLDLAKGGLVVGDIGGGPVTPLETKEALDRINPRVRMIVTEVPENALQYEVVFTGGILFERLKGIIIAQRSEFEKGAIVEVRYLRTKSGGQEFHIKFNPEHDTENPHYLTVAISPGVHLVVHGIDMGTSEYLHNVPLFLNLINTVGESNLNNMIEQLGQQSSIRLMHEGGEVVVNREPVKQDLARAGIEYLEAGNVVEVGLEQQFDLLLAGNIVGHFNEQRRLDFFQTMGKALKENGILVVKNKDPRVRGRQGSGVAQPTKLDVFKRTQGVLVYLGSAISSVGSSEISRESFDKYFASVKGVNRFMPFEAKPVYIFDAAQADLAMPQNDLLGKKGGIDLTPGLLDLQTNGDGTEIRYNINPAMIERYQTSPGFVPIIINIQPMTDLPHFLGIESRSSSSTAA